MISNFFRQQKSHRISLLFLILVFLAVSACLCQSAPYANLLTTKEPKSADVVGTYVLLQQTLTSSGLDFLDGEQSKIVINNNGTFISTNFPIWIKNDNGDYVLDRLLSSLSGNWSKEIVGGVSKSSNDIESVWGIVFSDLIGSANLTGKSQPYGLIFSYGDPDLGDVMIYKLQK